MSQDAECHGVRAVAGTRQIADALPSPSSMNRWGTAGSEDASESAIMSPIRADPGSSLPAFLVLVQSVSAVSR